MRKIVNNDDILYIIAQAWHIRPQLRLGQLIYNALQSDRQMVNLYNYEDNDLANRLASYYGVDMPSEDVVRPDGDVVD